MHRLYMKLAGLLAIALHRLGGSKNEYIRIGKYRYPVNELLAYPKAKVEFLLRKEGCTDSQINDAIAFFNQLRENKSNEDD